MLRVGQRKVFYILVMFWILKGLWRVIFQRSLVMVKANGQTTNYVMQPCTNTAYVYYYRCKLHHVAKVGTHRMLCFKL